VVAASTCWLTVFFGLTDDTALAADSEKSTD
jgi:hypothetical protein